MSTPKVKGFFKGFRYISHLFDNGKEQEMQIGLPTDVKHVAHIGWDGPSVNTPSWMNEFKSPSPYSSAPLSLNGSIHNAEPDNTVKWVSEDSKRGSRTANSQQRDLPDLPNSSRRQSTSSVTDSPLKEKSDKPKQSRRSSKPKDRSNSSKPTRVPTPTDSTQGNESPSNNLLDISKKTRCKKSKESSGGSGSSNKIKLKKPSSDPNVDPGSPIGSKSKSTKEQRPSKEGQGENGSSEDLLRNLV